MNSCVTCGKKLDFGTIEYRNSIYYNKGLFCTQTCKDEDIKRLNRIGTIDKITYPPPRTLMMNQTNGRSPYL